MAVNTENYSKILQNLDGKADLVAVSKIKPVEDIQVLYNLGQRDFGENYVQELIEKAPLLPKDINWHFIGHLQTNKVKYIAPFVYLIQSVDSEKLLLEIEKLAIKNNREIKCLLQIHIAKEETKFGFNEEECLDIINRIGNKELNFKNTKIVGLMGMASFSDDENLVRSEFEKLYEIYNKAKNILPQIEILSMGMSDDYELAVGCGSNMVRIGSKLFGARK